MQFYATFFLLLENPPKNAFIYRVSINYSNKVMKLIKMDTFVLDVNEKLMP